MIVQHPNGNSYLFINNRMFVSAYNETTKSVITVELNIHGELNDWEKEQLVQLPTHLCNNVYNGNCCSQEELIFGEKYCSSCNAYYEMMDKAIEDEIFGKDQ